ncbi:DNA-binding response regulator [Streptomyces sp. NBC_01185]|uniref:response regulator transcription factor n=1 Tax=Streptomyces sp. NBC_01185 TaxID=2903764 RepID=UPI00386DFAA8|nr:response regulator transcription factor [Streptomyces sp. NBC_01185]
MIRVLLAEDMHMVRGALVALLSLEPDITVVAQVDDGDQVVKAALRSRPDIAVLDIGLPGTDGLTAARALHEVLPSCGTLMVTSLDQPGMLQRALAARVSGYLLKDAPPEQLAVAIRKVAAGDRVIAPELMLSAWDHVPNPLTGRETEVLQFAAQGLRTGEIAAALYLSAGTVRNYLTAIVAKLDARNRVDAIRIARGAGWLS